MDDASFELPATQSESFEPLELRGVIKLQHFMQIYAESCKGNLCRYSEARQAGRKL